jgi:hypothetical protein
LGSQLLLLATRVDESLERVNEAAHGPTLSDCRDVPPIRRGDSALSRCRTSQTSTSSRAPRKGGGS